MTAPETVIVERAGSVTTVTINRPEAYNALNAESFAGCTPRSSTPRPTPRSAPSSSPEAARRHFAPVPISKNSPA